MVDQLKGSLLSGLVRRSWADSNDHEPRLVSVLDPGTEYVKALVVQLEGDRVVVIGEGMDRHKEMPFERGTRAVDLRLQQACDEALRQAEDMTESVTAQKNIPDHAVVSFPSQFTRQGAFTVQQKRTSPGTEITVKELEQVLARAERLALQQLITHLGTTRTEVSLIGSEVIDVQVDEHSVSDPVGFRGDTLSVTVFNALARNQHVAILDRLAEHLELNLLALVPEDCALADCLPMEEALVINMGGAVTSLAWVQGGCPKTTATLPLGGRHLTQRLATSFGLTPDRAETLKLRYGLGELSGEDAEAVGQALVPGVVEWLARVEVGLASLAAKRSLPPFIYVCGGGTSLPDVVEAVRGFPWLRHLKFVRYPEIHLFGAGLIPGVFNRTGRAWGYEMTLVAALARSAMPRKRRSDHIGGLFDRVVHKNISVYSGG